MNEDNLRFTIVLIVNVSFQATMERVWGLDKVSCHANWYFKSSNY